MMELKRPGRAAVAADHALAASLPDENLLDLSPAAAHSLDPTAFATVIAAALKNELRFAVARTGSADRQETALPRHAPRGILTPTRRVHGSESVAPKPMAHGALT